MYQITLTDQTLKNLSDLQIALNNVEVKGASNIGNMFVAINRLEKILQDFDQQMQEQNKPISVNNKGG